MERVVGGWFQSLDNYPDIARIVGVGSFAVALCVEKFVKAIHLASGERGFETIRSRL